MGGGGQTKEAKANQQQFNQQYQPYVATGGQRSQETYDYGKGAVGSAADFYRGVLSGEYGPGGGGDGGPTLGELTQEELNGLGADVYGEYKTTGGWGDQRKADFRGRAQGEAQAPYAQAMRQAAIGQAVQGGWGTGVNTSKLAMLRGAEQGRTSALLGADTEMEAAIDKGRQWGTGGMAGVTGQQISRRGQINAQERANAASRGAGQRAQFDAQEAAARGLLGSVDVMNTAGLPYYQAQGSGLGGWGGLSANLSQQRNPSTLQQIGGVLNTAASLGSGIGAAASAFPGKKKGAR